jgi:enterochelin esterase-like enzyme
VVARIAFTLACLLSAIPTSAAGEEPRHVRTVAEEFRLQSESLNEERLYWVHLPPSYDEALSAQRRYPVIYLLDGETHLHMTVGMVEFMSAGTYGNNAHS